MKPIVANLLLLAFAGVAQGPARGQGLVQSTPVRVLVREGFHVYHASASVGYGSNAGDLLNFNSSSSKDVYYSWASTSVGFSRNRGNTNFGITYTPSYVGTFYSGSLHSFNQDLGLELTRRFGEKWTYYVSAHGSDVTLQQFLFVASPSSQLTGGPASIDDVAGSLTSGASLLNPQTGLYGSRVLSLTGSMGLTFRPTTRLALSFKGTYLQSQPRRDSRQPQYLERSRSEEGGAGVTYHLSTRSFVSTNATFTNVQSLVGAYRLVYASGGYGRRLGVRWFAYASGGAGTFSANSPLKTLIPAPANTGQRASYMASASLGYKGRENGFAGIYTRNIGDTYGLGAGSTSSYQGSWNWHRRDRHWTLHAFGQQQTIQGGYLGNLGLWQAAAGFSRTLSRQTAASIQYSYMFTSLPAGLPYPSPKLSAVRFTIHWVPSMEDVTLTNPVPGSSGETLQ